MAGEGVDMHFAGMPLHGPMCVNSDCVHMIARLSKDGNVSTPPPCPALKGAASALALTGEFGCRASARQGWLCKPCSTCHCTKACFCHAACHCPGTPKACSTCALGPLPAPLCLCHGAFCCPCSVRVFDYAKRSLEHTASFSQPATVLIGLDSGNTVRSA